MKTALVALSLAATVCLAQVPPLPPGYPVKKKTTVLLSPKAASQVSVRMAKASLAAPAVMAASASTSGVTCGRSPVMFADTDGTNVLSSGIFTALKFTSPNPTKGSFIIMLSDDLNNWHKIKVSIGDDPLVVYDFTYLTQRQIFYKFVVDPGP